MEQKKGGRTNSLQKRKSSVLTQPKVSVIIPVYNVERYLEECLDSVLNQTLREIEVICVNDGASDRSPEILKKYAVQDARIRIITQKNAGAGAARNRGVAQARGEYIGFVDSDDVLYPEMYEELYQKASSMCADMVITGEVETTFGENIRFPENNSAVTADELSLGCFRAIEYPEILKNVFLWNRIYSRAFWLKNRIQIPENRKFAEDILCCTQTAVLAERIAYVSGPLYRYRNVREDSLSFTLAKAQDKVDFVVAVQETKQFLQDASVYDFFRENFLVFVVHLFAMLLQKMADYAFYERFLSGISEQLDREDIETLKRTWLYGEYPDVIHALEEKDEKEWRRLHRINRIRLAR